jgi:ABC-type phosphate transport system permease subunit
MVLPTITAISRTALVAVPRTLREGSYAVGATRWETIFRILVPTAAPGIVAATILAFGRAMGENHGCGHVDWQQSSFALAGGVALAVLTLPTILLTTEQALLGVPKTLREASYGLGATKFQTIFRIVLPVVARGRHGLSCHLMIP